MKHFVIVLFLALLAGGQTGTAETLRLEASVDAMGSVFSLVLYGENRDALEGAVEESFQEIRRLDRVMSNYRQDSEWSRINGLAAQRPVQVTRETYDLLEACLNYSRLSEGAFDITVGPLMRVWGFYKGSGRLAKTEDVAEALKRVGYRHLTLDPDQRTVRFDAEGVEIDPGGIGKGYAVDRIVGILRKKGIGSALVSAGGSSIFAIGTPPGEPGWRVDIKDPRDETNVAAEVVLKDESMSTSGTAEKFFRANGRLYAHIMDPRTGYPAEGILSASVIAPKTLDSEAWTKPFFIGGRKWAAKNKPNGFRVFLCESAARMEPPCAWLQ